MVMQRITIPEALKRQKMGSRASSSKSKMTIITRRSLLGSLALGSIANVEKPSALQLKGPEERTQSDGIIWTIARQYPSPNSVYVDFWSKPLCEIAYAAQLPLTVGRGKLMFNKGTINFQANAEQSHVDLRALEEHHRLSN